MPAASSRKISHDTFQVYHQIFVDDLESANAAPRTIETYGLSVKQLGAFLRGGTGRRFPAAVATAARRAKA